MNLVSVQDAWLRFAEARVLRGVSLGVDEGDRIGVIGRNGSGKSTLLRVLAGMQPLDDGAVVHATRVAVQLVPQEPQLPAAQTALQAVLAADSVSGRIFDEHRARPADPRLTALMDAHGLWDFEHVARGVLDRFEVPADRRVGVLSGGQRMRVALARGLVHSDVDARTGDTLPLLILDEPTNHLDLEAIEWLERRIRGQRGAVLLVTHDRYLLDRVATRIVETVDGTIHTEHGSYADYLANRAERAERAAGDDHRRRQQLRTELTWLQRSPPARTGKSKARIERVRTLLAGGPAPVQREVTIDLPARRLGGRVAALHNVGMRFDGDAVVSGITTTLRPGERIGLVGPNGSGKTTLLRLIAGRLEPDEGSVRHGATVHVGWYDQHTAAPDAGQRVLDAVSEVVLETRTSAGITLRAPELLERFGFPPATHRAMVSELSGGQRRRLELLRVLATAPNLLLLDEPTNDLDLDTLAVLEAFLETWTGTVVAASHDRFFLDRVCTSLWSMEPDGTVRDHPGGWTAYQAHRMRQQVSTASDGRDDASVARGDARSRSRGGVRAGRLSYREQRELHEIEQALPTLEDRRDAVHADLVAATDDHERAAALARSLDEVIAELERMETRWLELQLRTDAAS